MKKENVFGEIYDGMSHNYGVLEGIMSDLYQYLQDNPTDEMAKDVLSRLGIVGQNMIFSQRGFTQSYGDPSIKDSLINNLDSKSQALSSAEDSVKGKLR